jgi:hypothetical protein
MKAVVFRAGAVAFSLLAAIHSTASAAGAPLLPILNAEFNDEASEITLKNGAELAGPGSGVSGIAEDRAYLGKVTDAQNPAGGPVAVLKSGLATPGLEEYTITGWYKPVGPQPTAVTLISATGITIIGGETGQWTARVGAATAPNKMYWFNSGKDLPGGWVTEGQWRFFAFTWTKAGDLGTFYAGTVDSPAQFVRQHKLGVTAEGPIQGRNNIAQFPEALGNTSQTKYDRPFNGYLDNIRIYDRALTPELIEKIRSGDARNSPFILQLASAKVEFRVNAFQVPPAAAPR